MKQKKPSYLSFCWNLLNSHCFNSDSSVGTSLISILSNCICRSGQSTRNSGEKWVRLKKSMIPIEVYGKGYHRGSLKMSAGNVHDILKDNLRMMKM